MQDFVHQPYLSTLGFGGCERREGSGDRGLKTHSIACEGEEFQGLQGDVEALMITL